VAPDPEVVRLVPAELRAKGKVVLATNGPNAPIVFFKEDNTTLTGYTIDLGNAIGATMGLRVEWQNISFDSILPGLAAGRYDGAMSSFSIEQDRLATADFVSYYLSGGAFVIKRGSGIQVASFGSLCGYRVAVKKGVSQVEALVEANTSCASQGKQLIDVLQVPDSNAMVLTLQSGRADVVVSDKPQALYTEQQSNGQLCVSSVYETSHSIAGIAVPKGSSLATPLRAAVNSLLKSGAYNRIGAIWGTGSGQNGTTLSNQYRMLAAPLGVGPDGTLAESKIFIDPKQLIQGDDTYYYQPIREGCG